MVVPVKKRRKCRVIGERRLHLNTAGVGDTEEEEFSDDDLTDEDYNPDILSAEEIEQVELEEDEEWVEEEVNLYSTFATSSKVLCTKSNKLGVAFYYLNALDAAEEDTWKGKGGIIYKILDMFKIQGKGYYIWVKTILINMRECILKNVEYTGQNV